MGSQQIYALVDAFERDVRHLISHYIATEIEDDETLFGAILGEIRARQQADAAGQETALVEYLDLRPAYDLLNVHRSYLPAAVASATRELTSELDTIVPIRHRVMHSRPLAPDDQEAVISSLLKFDPRFWKRTASVLESLRSDPNWLPPDALHPVEDRILHNLPLSEYDETGLVGRDDDVKKIISALKRRRDAVITLCGEGGIGKTALALEVAYTLLDDPDEPFDIILWSSLKSERLTGHGIQSISDAAAGLTGVTSQFGAATTAEFRGNIEDLSELLAGYNSLLVIDNLETIGGEEFITLYESMPDSTTFLITSREGIGQIERRFQVGPLREVDALRLLNQMIKARDVASLSSISSETRRELVRRLRYSPLAIRWFILATEAGRSAREVIKDQSELLQFCVASVFENLSESAQEVFIAMEALHRPVSVDDLVIMLERPVNDLNACLKELTKGSLVRSKLANSAELEYTIELTETARQYAGLVVPRDHPIRATVHSNEKTFREDEERRARDVSQRMLGPNSVHLRSPSDAPTASLLRRALLMGRGLSQATAFDLVEEAKRLNPEYWEVYRTEALLSNRIGDQLRADESLNHALALADSEEAKAIVSYYYSGHLSRVLRDNSRALPHARFAHETLRSSETAVHLGNILVWSGAFDDGIALLEEGLLTSEGRGRIINYTALAEGYRRRAEWFSRESRNYVQAAHDAVCAFDLGLGELHRGTSDRRLRDVVCEAAILAVKFISAAHADLQGDDVDSEFLDRLAGACVMLQSSDHWKFLRTQVLREANAHPQHYGLRRVLKAVNQFDGEGYAETHRASGDFFHGRVKALKEGFGFIVSSRHPAGLYFHRTALSGCDFRELKVGVEVDFTESADDLGRPRAGEVVLP